MFGRSRAQGRLLAARYEERKLRKIIVSVSVLLAALIAVSVAFAAGTTTLEIKTSSEQGEQEQEQVHSDQALDQRRLRGHRPGGSSAALPEEGRDPLQRGRHVQRQAVPEVQGVGGSQQGPERLSEGIEDRQGHRNRGGATGDTECQSGADTSSTGSQRVVSRRSSSMPFLTSAHHWRSRARSRRDRRPPAATVASATTCLRSTCRTSRRCPASRTRR